MPHHVLIHIPAFGNIWTTATGLASHALRDYLHAKGMATGISSLSFPDIAELRAMVMTIWYDTMPQSDYLLFVDADMSFPPELVADMVLFNEAIVGTIYRQRKETISWAGSGDGAPQTERRGNFIKVEGVGFGCTLIKREVVTAMMARFPELIDQRIGLHPAGDTLRGAGTNRILRFFEKIDIKERGVISEDLSFCIRWKACGGQTWAAIGHKISHVGQYDYAGCYGEHVEMMARAQQQQMVAAQAPQGGMQLIQLPVQPLPASIMTAVKPNGRDGAPAMIDPPPAGLEERQLEAAE